MKDIVNQRFVDCVNYLLSEDIEPNKAQIGLKLSLKPSMFSEILNKRVNVSVEHIVLLCKQWKMFNPEWLITGSGDKIRSLTNILEQSNWITANEYLRFKSEKFDEEALKRVGYRIFIICETYDLQMHELGSLINDKNIPQYIAGILPVPEQTLDSILEAFPEISEKWLYTSFGGLKKQNKEILLKDLVDTQKKLIEYKDNEIAILKNEISELKKAEEPVLYSGMVAESEQKLKK